MFNCDVWLREGNIESPKMGLEDFQELDLVHWGSFPSDEDGYPFQPATTSASLDFAHGLRFYVKVAKRVHKKTTNRGSDSGWVEILWRCDVIHDSPKEITMILMVNHLCGKSL